jgi:MinD-like ATPase involved in chromosome partitioning or flagellar assembly
MKAARVDWSAATFSVSEPENNKSAVIAWLRDVFPHRIPDSEDGPSVILLDGPNSRDNIAIEFEAAEDGAMPPRGSLGTIESDIDFTGPSHLAIRARPVPLIACHSVKGGTGRTTTAVALATTWARMAKRPILLVDADLEAPGLSYLYRATRPEIEVSLEDLLVLAHASSDTELPNIIEWVGLRLSSQQLGNLLVLPLRRSLDELASSAIRAEHLASQDRPYAFADLLTELAHACGCAGVVVDVRAGLVPLAAQLVLDPQVARVIVTSLAGQSLEATVALMAFVAREMRKQGIAIQQPLLVVNRVPGILRDIGGDEKILAPILSRIEASLLADDTSEVSPDSTLLDSPQEISPLTVVKLGEVADLQVPASRWDGFGEQLEASGFNRRLNVGLEPWLEAILPTFANSPAEQAAANEALDQPTAAADRRRRLAEFTSRFIAAETADKPVETPLVTGPMRALAMESVQPPIIVCEGAKGTGKTLTARFLVSKQNWETVVSNITGSRPNFDALILPVLGSIQASATFLAEIDAARLSVSHALGNGAAQPVSTTKDILREKLQQGMSEREWTETWLDVIAWSAGIFVGDPGAGGLLLESLRSANKQIIAIIEGVEELYESATNPALHAMLRALLVDLPVKLRSMPGRPLGLIVFARRDTVDAGVSQNRSQFRQQYQDYSLTWTEGDVLELAAWLATSSDALHIWTQEFRSKSLQDKERLLYPLWGRKLGPDDQPGKPRVPEAYTAGWIIAALSDLQERLVARDLVRFLYNAASNPNQVESRENYGNRLLFPRALREAMGPTSRSKVTETEEEIPELAPAFDKFKENNNRVKAPIDQESISALNLSADDLENLKKHGIILGENPPYEVPELFRMGLGLRHAGARYSVVGTRRRARQRLIGSI